MITLREKAAFQGAVTKIYNLKFTSKRIASENKKSNYKAKVKIKSIDNDHAVSGRTQANQTGPEEIRPHAFPEIIHFISAPKSGKKSP